MRVSTAAAKVPFTTIHHFLDAELEKRNHAYAVETSRKMLDGKNSACAWGRTMHAFTGSKSESIDDEAILKYRDQSGGCSCKGDCSTKRCGKYHAKNVPSDVLARGSARTHRQHQNYKVSQLQSEPV